MWSVCLYSLSRFDSGYVEHSAGTRVEPCQIQQRLRLAKSQWSLWAEHDAIVSMRVVDWSWTYHHPAMLLVRQMRVELLALQTTGRNMAFSLVREYMPSPIRTLFSSLEDAFFLFIYFVFSYKVKFITERWPGKLVLGRFYSLSYLKYYSRTSALLLRFRPL